MGESIGYIGFRVYDLGSKLLKRGAVWGII